jgi:hypothetical protein
VSEQDHPGLVVLEDAWDSAAKASFRRPQRALEVLEAIAALADVFHDKSLDSNFQAFLADRGVRLGFTSVQTRTRWPHNYKRTYKGRSIELSDHAKVGTGSPGDHLRVYWYRDEEERLLVIGHVGDHLANAMS